LPDVRHHDFVTNLKPHELSGPHDKFFTR